MKISRFFFHAILFSIGFSALGEDEPAARNTDRGRNLTAEQRMQFFKRLDRNQDGKLARSEVPERAWEKLGRADRDGDDAVSKAEMEAAAKAMQAMQSGGRNRNRRPSGATGVMQSFDENTDEKLTQNEVSAGMWAKISRLDSDNDGSVSRAELGKAYGS